MILQIMFLKNTMFLFSIFRLFLSKAKFATLNHINLIRFKFSWSQLQIYTKELRILQTNAMDELRQIIKQISFLDFRYFVKQLRTESDYNRCYYYFLNLVVTVVYSSSQGNFDGWQILYVFWFFHFIVWNGLESRSLVCWNKPKLSSA